MRELQQERTMIDIRTCSGLDELEACVELQIATWGYDASDVVPRKSFLVSQSIGGQLLGAFEETGNSVEGIRNSSAKSLVGFAFSMPGIKIFNGRPQPYLHSHMLAVRELYRNRGIGAELKRAQRREALSRGIRYMEWTFDPLEIKNAHLNIHRLGVIARSYRVNFYGVSSSRLQGGLPTDRLVAEWELDSPRVEAIVKEDSANVTEVRDIEERILVPASIYQWKASEEGRKQALAVQAENRHKFQAAFQRGLAVVGFSLDAEGNGIYELGLAETRLGF